MRKHVVQLFSHTTVVNGVDHSSMQDLKFDTKEQAEKFVDRMSKNLCNSGLTHESIYYIGEKWFPDPEIKKPIIFEEIMPNDFIDEPLPF